MPAQRPGSRRSTIGGRSFLPTSPAPLRPRDRSCFTAWRFVAIRCFIHRFETRTGGFSSRQSALPVALIDKRWTRTRYAIDRSRQSLASAPRHFPRSILIARAFRRSSHHARAPSLSLFLSHALDLVTPPRTLHSTTIPAYRRPLARQLLLLSRAWPLLVYRNTRGACLSRALERRSPLPDENPRARARSTARCCQQVIPHVCGRSAHRHGPRCRVAVSHAARRYTPPHGVVIVA